MFSSTFNYIDMRKTVSIFEILSFYSKYYQYILQEKCDFRQKPGLSLPLRENRARSRNFPQPGSATLVTCTYVREKPVQMKNMISQFST